VFGTLVVILVFIPLFARSGVEGRLFAPLGVAYIVSILASLLVSLTVTPVLSFYLLPKARATHRQGDSLLLRVLKWLATGLIRVSMAAPGWILLIGWIAVALCAWQLSMLGGDLLPEFDEGSVQVNVFLPPGSSLQASNRVCAQVDAKLRTMLMSADQPQAPIRHFVRRTGRAELDEHVEPVSNTEYILNMNPNSGRSRAEIINQLQDELHQEVPEAGIEVEQPLSHLISHMVSGVSAHIAVKIYGDDLEVLRRLAEQVQRVALTVPNVRSAEVEGQKLIEELHIRLRPDALSFYGLERAQVAEVLETALAGEIVGQVLEGQKRFDLVLLLDDPFRKELGTLGRLQIKLPSGRGRVALSDLADIVEADGPSLVSRENAHRRITVKVNTRGGDLAGTAETLRDRIAERVSFPPGYYPVYGGRFESQQEASRLVWLLILLSGVGIFLVLYVLYPSWRVVLQIMNAFPMAFIGGVLALWWTGQTQTVACLVGFISLGGIATRNGILLVSHYFHLMRHEGESFSQEMILRGSLERLAPVLMTAVTAGIGLIPLVIDGNKPGREILYPVATVILGGLITSTLCEYLLHPGLFWRFSGKDAIRIAKEKE
jgi:HME family heavy-metal exporter